MIEQMNADQFTIAFCGIVIGVCLVALVVNVLWYRWIRSHVISRFNDLWVDSDD